MLVGVEDQAPTLSTLMIVAKHGRGLTPLETLQLVNVRS